MGEARVETEERVKAALGRGDHDTATTAALSGYGPEILGLLVALHRDHDLASEAFSVFAEKLWTSMKRFEGKCSMRTWAYLLARRASMDVARSERPRGKRAVPLSLAPEVSALVARVRTNTLSILSEQKVAAFTELRRELSEEDQLLLVLRVDRDLPWEDLVLVFLGDDADAETKKRESARLRKRFQLVKERLRTLGRERGLIE
jgi:RNA polymerase sigma-70 factor (ECF subfamily)